MNLPLEARNDDSEQYRPLLACESCEGSHAAGEPCGMLEDPEGVTDAAEICPGCGRLHEECYCRENREMFRGFGWSVTDPS